MPAARAAARAAPEAMQEPVADTPAPAKGRLTKKLMLLVVAALVITMGIGAFALFMMWRAPSLDDELFGDQPAGTQAAAVAPGPPPAYLPLDNFVFNLADTNADRYAQIGITLQLVDAKFAETVKGYMPAVRNNILMVLAHKKAEELLSREGKQALAEEIARAAVRPMGIQVAEGTGPGNPVQAVHFSSFIIQ